MSPNGVRELLATMAVYMDVPTILAVSFGLVQEPKHHHSSVIRSLLKAINIRVVLLLMMDLYTSFQLVPIESYDTIQPMSPTPLLEKTLALILGSGMDVCLGAMGVYTAFLIITVVY